MTDERLRLAAALADRYRIERELGRGGMATVYLAEDLKHRRKVALKVLRPELAEAMGAERFLREIETTANLRHPHILPLHDSGDAEGALFYVMPLVEGESLRDRLTREKQLSVEDALRIAREVADALAYANGRGVIHRDIKPENILLESGHAVVADFGIARAVSAAGSERLTETGLSVGTSTYMSPEQAAGEAGLDGRSDLYALACVLYEMVAGQPPFTGTTAASVIHQHLTVTPRPVSQLRPAVPAAVVDALQRALAKNPADRFSGVAQFADALGAASLTSGPTSAASAPAARGASLLRRPMVLLTAAVLVALIGIAGARWLGVWGGSPATKGVPSVAVLPFVDLSGGENEYLGDGMAETLISALSRIEGLRVTARTSAFSFKGRNEDVRTIGEKLGVGAVLEGSVQRSGDKLRITAQLVNATDGFELWSENFDRNVADVFAVQDEVARAVVSALQVKLIGDASAPVVQEGTESIEAYQAYLQGLFFWNRRTRADIERSAEFFQKAIEADSGFASAWAGLANAYVLFLPSEYRVTTISPAEALARAERAARRALRIDGENAPAHTALASMFEKRGQVEEAGESFRRAIAADPRYATAHQWYASNLAVRGQLAEAVAAMREAVRLDPLSFVMLTELGEMLDVAGDRPAATAAYEHALELHPDAYVVQYFAGLHFLVLRDFARAGDLLGRTQDGVTNPGEAGRRFGQSLQDPTRRDAALRAMADTAQRPELAVASSRALGDDAAAIAGFQRGVEGTQFQSIYMPHVLALFGPSLASDPRVQAAMQRFYARLRVTYGVKE